MAGDGCTSYDNDERHVYGQTEQELHTRRLANFTRVPQVIGKALYIMDDDEIKEHDTPEYSGNTDSYIRRDRRANIHR